MERPIYTMFMHTYIHMYICVFERVSDMYNMHTYEGLNGCTMDISHAFLSFY